MSQETRTGLEIAIIGMAGRFPGAKNLDEFWSNLKNGKESITFFSSQELLEAGAAPAELHNPNYVKAKGIIEEPEYFDAAFFNYTPTDAEMLDPQVRIFHECVWEALENAGYSPETYPGSIGLYAGAAPNLYWEVLTMLSKPGRALGFYAATQLSDKDYLSARVSYKLNLKGPAVSIQTLCSTSLVAVHEACRGLLIGDCNLALAGGVTLFLPHIAGYLYQEGMILSRDGHCRAFDAESNGTVFGEGAGVVVLKRLDEALLDGDYIYAVIKGTGVNNDGRRKIGFTAPSIEGQSQVIQQVHFMASVEPESISYLEAHGTGTRLGDPIEIEALKQAFQTSKRQFCGIGSVKTNIGHLDATAGIAGLIKTVLAIQHRKLPPSLHFQNPNPKIDFENSPFYLVTQLMDWKNGPYPLRAGVSSFGIGGTNAHVVLEEAPARVETRINREWKLLTLSAKTPSALQQSIRNLIDYLQNHPAANFNDVAYTLQVGRTHFQYRRSLVCSKMADALEQLTAVLTEPEIPARESPRVVFLFPDQDSRNLNIGWDLYQKEPLFRHEMDEGLFRLKAFGIDGPASIHPGAQTGAAWALQPPAHRLICFVFEYALAKFLLKLGIRPQAVLGQGVGEYVAACISGVFSPDDACALLMADGPSIPVGAPLRPVFSVKEEAAATGLPKTVLDPTLNPPQIPFISSRTGAWITVAEATNLVHWRTQPQEITWINDGISRLLCEYPEAILIEVGAGRTLGPWVEQNPNYQSRHFLTHLVKGPDGTGDELHFFTQSLGHLWRLGISCDWQAWYEGEEPRRIPLPTYPFERRRYWIEGNPFQLIDLARRNAMDQMGTTYLPSDRNAAPISPAIPPGAPLPADKTMAIPAQNEAKLTEIWRQILGIHQIEAWDDFFELGGDSLTALSLTAVINREFGIELPLSQFFEKPTIRGVAEYLSGKALGNSKEIRPIPKQASYPVSAAQKRLFFLTRFEDNPKAYNMPGAALIEGNICRDEIAAIFQKIVDRHEAFRTSFEMKDGELLQRIDPGGSFTLEYQEAQETDLDKTIAGFIRKFDLAQPPLLRAGLIKLNHDKHLLVYDMHHIISDGVSLSILIRDFITIFEGKELPELAVQSKDYTDWQNHWFDSEEFNRQENFWKESFQDEIPVLNLPLDHPRPALQNFTGAALEFELAPDLASKLAQLAKTNGATLFMVLLAAYNALLYRYTGMEDLVVGSPIAGRKYPELKNVIGMFVNTLALRNQPQGGKPFREFLLEVKVSSLKAFENQDYPFDLLVERLNLKQDLSRNPLFDVMFVLQNMGLGARESKGVKFIPYPIDSHTAKFDLLLQATENSTGIGFRLEYCTLLFDPPTISRMIRHFTNILTAVARDSELTLDQLEMLSPEEKQEILVEFNNTRSEYPLHETITGLFERQAAQTPDQTAVIFAKRQLTYEEFNQKANQLARRLRAAGARPNQIIGVSAERSLELMIGIMAIHKAGSAYLPINPHDPVERKKYLLKDAGIEILLTQSHLQNEAAAFCGCVIELDQPGVYTGAFSNLEPENTAADLAYVIYTSGSTGKPKGVTIEHHSLTNRLLWMQKQYPIGPGDVILQKTPVTFDVSVWELFWWGITGAAVCFLKPEGEKDPEAIVAAIESRRITTIHFVPSMLSAFLLYVEAGGEQARLKSLRQVFASGEALSLPQVTKFNELLYQTNQTRLINLYGPTEATVDVSYFNCSTGEGPSYPGIIPIGKPIDNIQLLVTDPNQRLQPVGVPGELCIAGVGLARGYLNQPELTAEKFVSDPMMASSVVETFHGTSLQPSIQRTASSIQRIYRTGDLARWCPGGDIEYLGRIDHQVKIRGFRIELGEIEARLVKHPAIGEAVVIPREDSTGGKYLCAYWTADPGAENQALVVQELRAHLAEVLPEYMIPSYFVQLDQLPLTASGKVNRKALAGSTALEPAGKIQTGVPYAAPRDEIESQLALLWQEILETGPVGIDDNFFELGGHSLRAMFLLSRVHSKMGAEIPLREFFVHPTIRKTAQYIKTHGENIFAAIQAVPVQEYYGLSPAQKRLYILSQLEEIQTAYNIPGAAVMEGDPDCTRIKAVFAELIQRHESFRTSFEFIQGEPVQRIHPTVEFAVEDWNGAEVLQNNPGDCDPAFIAKVIAAFVRPFDLSKAPLMRVGLAKLALQKYLLIYDFHHIITDGTSIGILIQDFATLYDGKELPELRLQYKDYAAWQNSLMSEAGQAGAWQNSLMSGVGQADAWQNSLIRKQEEYWLSQFTGEIPVLNLPVDYPRPPVQSFEGARLKFGAGLELTRRIKQMSHENGATLYMALLAAYTILMAKYAAQEDIVVGSPIAGRSHSGLEKIIGFFINTLAMRNFPARAKTFREFLTEVKLNSLQAFENQDYPFETLVERLNLQRDLSRNPLFDTMFTLQNFNARETELARLRWRLYEWEAPVAKFDLSLDAIEQAEEIQFVFEYGVKIFKPETIATMAGHFLNLLHLVCQEPERRIGELEIITTAEKRRILTEFNTAAAEPAGKLTVLDLFEKQAHLIPGDLAVLYQEQQLTYGELNEKSNRLARRLRKGGIGPGSIVAVTLDRSVELLIGVLGVMKAGGAYLPVDPGYPAERIQYLLEDSGAQIIITRTGLDIPVNFSGEILDIGAPELKSEDKRNPTHLHQPGDPVYIIFTSGTTGKPKGVLVEHGQLMNITLAWQKAYGLTGMKVKLLQMASFSFDVFTGDLARALCNGGMMVICPEIIRVDPPALYGVMIQYGINIVESTPAVLLPLMNYIVEHDLALPELGLLILGSDKCPVEDFQNLCSHFGEKFRIINSYGVTEAAIDSSFYENRAPGNEPGPNLPIGKPLSNVKYYILSENLSLQPIGVPGELFIGGLSVARGYLNRPELTAEKFVPNPMMTPSVVETAPPQKGIHGTSLQQTVQRMYKTGDLARWLPDGNVEFLGRMDNQVKIRGYRIELGEIEAVLTSFEPVKEAVVMAQGKDSENKVLAAYLVAAGAIRVSELREYLRERLPGYMIPSFFIQLDQMPLTPNGKIDRRALPEPEGRSHTGIEYIAPRNELEAKLAEIWQEILAVGPVGINDNFFELGGHSLKATALAAKAHKLLNLELPLREAFQKPTVREQAIYLENTRGELHRSIPTVTQWRDYPAGYFPVASAQKRLFILDQFEGAGTSYNLPDATLIEGPLDRGRLETAFFALIRRHESFRTSFLLFQGEPAQRIHPMEDPQISAFRIEYEELGADSAAGQPLSRGIPEIIQDFIQPFDLKQAPLLRVKLVKVAPDRHLLLHDMHHIISDGASMEILVREFIGLYEGQNLPELRLQYKDYAVWQTGLQKDGAFAAQEAYWRQILAGEIPVLNLPVDYPRPPVQSFEGNWFKFEFSPEFTERVEQTAAAAQTTLYMILTTALNILLFKYTGQEDIIIGSPIAGRSHTDLESIIGMFVNTLALRNYPAAAKTIREFIAEVKENSLQAYENQDYQFEELIEKLNLRRDLSRNPLFDVMLVLQNMEIRVRETNGLRFIPYEYENHTTKFDLTFQAVESGGQLRFCLEYCAPLFETETIVRMSRHFQNILAIITTQPELKLAEIEMLSPEEKQEILVGFNSTRSEYPLHETITGFFERQAAQTPDETAVIFAKRQLTYEEFNQKANQLARRLRAAGARPNQIIGVSAERSLELMIGIMAIHKAGSAYLPINPHDPVERKKYLLNDAGIEILLTQSHLHDEAAAFCGCVIQLDQPGFYTGAFSNLEPENTAADLAYVIYTSGSTGKPKGVTIEHHSLTNRLLWMQQQYPIGPGDVILQKTPVTFDVSVWELFWWGMTGAAVCFLKPEGEKDPEAIVAAIESRRITTIHFVPSMLSAFLGHVEAGGEQARLKSLRQVFASGEALSLPQVTKFNELLYQTNQTRLINLYGPTEATVDVSYFNCSTGEGPSHPGIIPIGKPIDNIQLLVIDPGRRLQPVGVPGELCIAGVGLARGYLNQPELTAEKFVVGAFRETPARIYRTGDLARWRPGGDIEYLGRIDHQVKIRGFRIELGEIEARLVKHPAIGEAVVIPREDSTGGKYLCAYWTADPGAGNQALVVQELRAHLAEVLPEYMIPSYFVQLDQLPLTASGKVNRKALAGSTAPEPAGKIQTGVPYAPPPG